jgi:alpha-tubulin suppressor-like RCC1 family protein
MSTWLFVDTNIPDYQIFIDGIKPEIKIEEFVPVNISATRVGFVWENSNHLIPWGTKSYLNSRYFTQEFVDFISLNPNIIVDLITCSLSSADFISDVNKLKELYPGVTIEYSLDQTGSFPGNWILESNQIDIKQIYFTSKIDEWNHTLLYIPNYGSIFNVEPIMFDISTTLKPYDLFSSDISNVKYVQTSWGPDTFYVIKIDGSVLQYGTQITGSGITSFGSVSSSLTSGVVNIFNNGGTTVDNTSSGISFAALKSNGSVITWGSTNNGGNSTGVSQDISSGIITIVSNNRAFAALNTNGAVSTWGFNQTGGSGYVFYPGRIPSSRWESKVASLTSNIIGIFNTDSAFAALKSDGTIVTWGNDESGGNYSASNVINIFSTINAFAALKSDGSVVTWGDSTGGGDSSNVSNYLTSGVVNIFSTNNAFAALKSNGSVVAWGDSTSGGNLTDVSNYLTSGVVNIFSTEGSFAALKSNGSVVTWGDPTTGGDSTDVSNYLTSGVSNIYCTINAFAALKLDGSVVAWGLNGGASNATDVSNYLTSGVIRLVSAASTFLAFKTNGLVIKWGGIGWDVISLSNITYAYSSTDVFALVSSNSPPPLTPVFLTKANGLLTVFQSDLNTSNINSYEYKVGYSLSWASATSLDISSYQISGLVASKTYYLKLRAKNTVASGEANGFLVKTDSNGTITITIQTTASAQSDNELNISPSVLPNSSICFPAGTPINTDQGLVPIEQIDINYHTIRHKQIQAITQTILTLNFLICLEPNGLGPNIPSIQTIISPNHKIFNPKTREMCSANELAKSTLDTNLIYPIKYSGEVMYNVLLETYEKMIVNNMIVETLDPTNVIAQIYLKKMSKEKREYLINTFNNFMKTNSKHEYKKLLKLI